MYTSTSHLTLILMKGAQRTRGQNYVALQEFRPDLLPNKFSFENADKNKTLVKYDYFALCYTRQKE